MPIYDYACSNCEHRFEARHPADHWIAHCPACGGAVKKLLSAPAIHGKMARGRETAMASLNRETPKHCHCRSGGIRAHTR
ncbi:MAG TPA: zinc ribbon domain-containing protein [Betaproteobacteria bacterium]|nr:zinc ribbon domain-containing protein [Betaproteobacteria bacterium]